MLLGAQMNHGEMLSGMIGKDLNEGWGWLAHVIIGILFAFIFVYVLNTRLPFGNQIFKGLIYGAMIFAFTQIMLFLASLIGVLPLASDSGMASLAVKNLIGHLAYGGILGAIIKKG